MMKMTLEEEGMRGDKTPMDMPQKVAGVVGFPHSNVRIDTGVNAETGETYKRVLLDQGATRIKARGKSNGTQERIKMWLQAWR